MSEQPTGRRELTLAQRDPPHAATDTVVECEEVPVATTVFAVAAGVMGIGALASAVAFFLTGGLRTLPWVGRQMSSATAPSAAADRFSLQRPHVVSCTDPSVGERK